jgi:hypothetical protein
MEVAGHYDACQDVPWAALFRELDERFPDSLFIHTIRNDSAWLESARHHFGDTDIPLHRWLYGVGRLSGNENLYLDRYKRHNREVQEYFSADPSRLLIMNLDDGLGWRRLCRFLDCPEPRQAFPHENRAPDRLSALERLNRSTKATLPAPIRRLGSRFKRILYRLARKDPYPDIFHNRDANRREIQRYKLSNKADHDRLPGPY